jgi:hypothetical protein
LKGCKALEKLVILHHRRTFQFEPGMSVEPVTLLAHSDPKYRIEAPATKQQLRNQ